MKLLQRDKEVLGNLKSWLETQIAEEVSIERLCRQSGLNRDKLIKGFKEIYGVTPCTFQLQTRIQEARRLLRESEIPVTEVAWTLGYQHVSSFCTAFKENTGLSPLSYRNSVREQTLETSK
ncbi:MAG: helix-turn-helix transcriptional regulator [Sphingobacteriales bacterium]|nr:helix-turn-helix transcriptional regulator [Sphingobacteriales bacterium]